MELAVSHGFFIAASYIIVGVVVAGLIAWVVFDGRRIARDLDRLEAQGIRRRSARAGVGEGEST